MMSPLLEISIMNPRRRNLGNSAEKKVKCFGLVSHANSSDLITGINKMTKRSDKDYFYFFAQSVCRMRPTGEERKEKKTAFYAN